MNHKCSVPLYNTLNKHVIAVDLLVVLARGRMHGTYHELLCRTSALASANGFTRHTGSQEMPSARIISTFRFECMCIP